MATDDNHRTNRCPLCNGAGVIRIGGRDDYKNTEKMSPAELNAIVREVDRTSIPFGSEPPTLPDEGWTARHLAVMQTKQWRWIQLGLSLLLIALAYVIGRQR